MSGVVHLHGRIGFDQVRGHFTWSAGGQTHHLLFIAVKAHDESLDVQDDVGDVLLDAGQRREFVLGPGDADTCNGRPFD